MLTQALLKMAVLLWSPAGLYNPNQSSSNPPSIIPRTCWSGNSPNGRFVNRPYDLASSHIGRAPIIWILTVRFPCGRVTGNVLTNQVQFGLVTNNMFMEISLPECRTR